MRGTTLNLLFFGRVLAVLLAVLGLTSACGSSFRSIGTSSAQAADPIDVTCDVVTDGRIVAARLKFVNASAQEVLVKRGIQGYGVKENMMQEPGELHADEFLITAGGVTIPYVGIEDIVVRGVDRTNFSPVRAQEVIAVRFNRLDTSYAFLPGTHQYTVHHIHLQMDSATGRIIEHKSRAASFTYTKR